MEIPEFTGISAPYEELENPKLVIETDRLTIDEEVAEIISYLEKKASYKPIALGTYQLIII